MIYEPVRVSAASISDARWSRNEESRVALRGGHESSRRWCPGWCPPELNLCSIWELLEISLSSSFYLLPGAESGFKEGRDGGGTE